MKKSERITDVDARIIIAMDECDSNVDAVCQKLHYVRKTVNTHLRKIHRVTGLNARGVFELPELVQIAKHILGDEYGNN